MLNVLLLLFYCMFFLLVITPLTPLQSGTQSYNCRSAELLSTFKRLLKTELFDIAYSELEHSA